MKGKSSGKGKRKEHVILNNGKIEYTYSEAEKRGISRATFMRAIDTLVQRGFIDITHSGSGGKRGDKSLYAISERWMNWGKDEFEEATRPKDTRQGRGFARYWKKKGKNG
jgi:DNA-binding PadR family transcriptional regulator